MKTTLVLSAALAVVLAGCSSTVEDPTGGVAVTASPLALSSQIEQVTLTANPGGHTANLTLDPASGQYLGSLVLPVGAYTLEAAAFGDVNGDGIPELVGTGATAVVVYQNQTTAAVIRILDVTGPPPVPNHGPFITSVTMSNVFAVVGQPLSFSATAVDVDGDPLSYSWTETCTSGAPSTFSAATSATTTWQPAAAGICTIQLTVFAAGLTDTARFDMPVYTTGPEGIVSVRAYFVSNPAIGNMNFYGVDAEGVSYAFAVHRTLSDATLPHDVPVGGDVYVELYTANGASMDAITLADDCGASFMEVSRSGSFLAAWWHAPSAPTVCLVSGSIERDGLRDTLPVAVNVGGVFTYAVSGTITGPGAVGATVSLAGPFARTTTADATGAYAFRGIPNGSYVVTPSLGGFAFQPQSRSVTVGGMDVAGQDFASQSIALAPAAGERSFFETGVPAPGWLPRFGELVRLDATTLRGDVVASARVIPFSWYAAGGDVVAWFDFPRATSWEYPTIWESPAPPEIQQAYAAWYGEGIQTQVDTVASRFHPLSQAGAVYGVEDVQTQRVTWGPFDLYGQTYVYFSERTQTLPVQLAERAAAPTVPWTATLAEATWALGTYYAAPGLSYVDQQPFPPEYNGDLLTFQPQGTGFARRSGRTFLWSISAGVLNLLFSDGSSETLEIVDAGGDVWGLWSEHRDAWGTLVAGRYDWAFRAAALPPATVAAFATSPTEYWQQMINAWTTEAWAGTELRWDWTFGWNLLPDGTGNNIQAYVDPWDGMAYFDVIPLTWYPTDTGQLRIDRFTFSTGENRGYRLLTPMAIGADGMHVYVLEEEYRKQYEDFYGPYYVLLAPRITVYERRTIPPPTPPAP